MEQRQALVVRGGPQGVRAEGTRLRLWTPGSPSRQEGARPPKPVTARTLTNCNILPTVQKRP